MPRHGVKKFHIPLYGDAGPGWAVQLQELSGKPPRRLLFAHGVGSGYHGPLMPRRSGQSRRVPKARRKRVGRFIKKRRMELGLSQGDLCKLLGYRSRNSVSNIEVGNEGLPPKRAHEWADALQVPRADFFAFVIGEKDDMKPGGPHQQDGADKDLTAAEKKLVLRYRRLEPRYQQRLLEQLDEFTILQKHTPGTKRRK